MPTYVSKSKKCLIHRSLAKISMGIDVLVGSFWDSVSINTFEYTCAHLSCKEGHTGAIDPGIVSSRRHCLQVVLTLRGGYPGTSQLAIIDLNHVSLHCPLHLYQSICSTHTQSAQSRQVSLIQYNHHVESTTTSHLMGAPTINITYR